MKSSTTSSWIRKPIRIGAVALAFSAIALVVGSACDPGGACDELQCEAPLTCVPEENTDEASCACVIGSNGATCGVDSDCASGQVCGTACSCLNEGTGGSGGSGGSGAGGSGAGGSGAGGPGCATDPVTDGPITISGTLIDAAVVDGPGVSCGETVCTIVVDSGHTEDVFYTYAPFSPSDALQLSPSSMTIPAMSTQMLDVLVEDCSSPNSATHTLDFFDDQSIPTQSWHIPVTITTTIQ